MVESTSRLVVRPGTLADSTAIAQIYNDGIDDRIATFETRHRTAEDIAAWFDGRHPVVVATMDDKVVAFAATSSYRPRECYAGIAEYSVYVAREARGQGAGHAALTGLIEAAREAGFWKLVSRIFPENTASLRLAERVGFRRVGVYERHARLDGEWKDVVIVECLIDRRPDE